MKTKNIIITAAMTASISMIARDWPTSQVSDLDRTRLESTFRMPDSIQTSCYWYWISGNVSPEGISKDVKSMKKAGINRAFIGFQGLEPGEAPRGPVYIQTPEWYECVRTAMRTASEEGIEIGVFNCPGWSQSGGPWVTPQQSQRYLASVKVKSRGGKIDIVLPRPENLLSDVAVLAFPGRMYSSVSPRLNPADSVLYIDAPADGFTLRSVILKTASPVRGSFRVSVPRQNGEWEEIVQFEADRTNMMIEVGYDRLAPTAISIPPVCSGMFRLDYRMNPDCRIDSIVFSERPVVDAYPDKILSKMFQTPLPFWEQYKWRPAVSEEGYDYVSADDVVNLSGNLKGDRLVAELPEGTWNIVRTYMAPTGIPNSPALEGDGKGLEIDRWNRDGLRHHYDSFIGDIERHVPAEDRKSWKVIVSDSYERATQNFGDDFCQYFEKHFGYDPLPYLLTYSGEVIESPEKSDRFLWDVRRMIADRLAYDHLGALREIANEDGKTVWLEPYGHWGFPGEFMMYGGQSDEVAGEFWSEGDLGNIENRAASSIAHTYGKGKTSSESFTVGGPEFTRSPRTMKKRGDRFFSEGVNNTLLHLMVSQPDDIGFPGLNCPFGNEFNRKNTWFSHLDLFTDYLKRANLMLQQGNYVADVAYFIGEDTPVMTGTRNPEIPYGYQFDYINAEVIENTLQADGDHLLYLPHGTKYRLLVLPPLKTMRPELLRKIKKLIEDGAYVLGDRVQSSPSLENFPQCDVEVRALADQIWGKESSGRQMRNLGNGMVFSGYSIDEIFDRIGLTPDFSTGHASNDIKYAHTSSPRRDIYFLANQSDSTISFNAVFRDARKRVPELWDAAKGTMRCLPDYAENGNITTIPLKLADGESVFVVFEKDVRMEKKPNYPVRRFLARVDSPWKVSFRQMNRKGFKIELQELTDLSLSGNDDLRYFSGSMSYSSEFEIPTVPKGKRIELNLGNVREMVKVRINGKDAGGVWTPPYTLDITDLVRKGKNKIEAEVVNNWNNRLVGDARLPETRRSTSYFFHYLDGESPLQPSGLIGPVEIHEYSE